MTFHKVQVYKISRHNEEMLQMLFTLHVLPPARWGLCPIPRGAEDGVPAQDHHITLLQSPWCWRCLLHAHLGVPGEKPSSAAVLAKPASNPVPVMGDGRAWSRRMEHGHDATLEDAARGGRAVAAPGVPFGVLSRSAFRSRCGLKGAEVLWVWDTGGLLALGLCYGQKRQFG